MTDEEQQRDAGEQQQGVEHVDVLGVAPALGHVRVGRGRESGRGPRRRMPPQRWLRRRERRRTEVLDEGADVITRDTISAPASRVPPRSSRRIRHTTAAEDLGWPRRSPYWPDALALRLLRRRRDHLQVRLQRDRQHGGRQRRRLAGGQAHGADRSRPAGTGHPVGPPPGHRPGGQAGRDRHDAQPVQPRDDRRQGRHRPQHPRVGRRDPPRPARPDDGHAAQEHRHRHRPGRHRDDDAQRDRRQRRPRSSPAPASSASPSASAPRASSRTSCPASS